MTDLPFSPNQPAGPPPGAHPLAAVLAAHAAGSLTSDAGTRVDLHVERCLRCRFALNEQALARHGGRHEANLLAIAGELDAPRRGLLERSLVGVGAPVDTVRLMLATPSLRRSWFIAVAVALLLGMVAANPNRPDSSLFLFLMLAPLLPVIGVALAYGAGVDPSYEMTVATPLSGIRLVLIRSVAVLGSSIAIAGTASLLMLPRHTLMVAAWIVPALAMSLVCLALMTVVAARAAAAIMVGGWLAVIAVCAGAVDQLAPFRAPGQLVFLVLGVLAAIVLAGRRRVFDIAQGDVS